MLRELSDIFWAREFWLPPNVTWEDVRPGPDKDVAYPDSRLMWFSIPLALVLIVLRRLLEMYCFAPFGKKLGIANSRRTKAPANPKLEAAYRVSPKIKQTELCGLAKQLDMSERQVERWWRLRRSQDKPSTLVKFSVDCWRCTFYANISIYALFIFWDKEWFWNFDYCHIGHPHQGITTGETWYYIISSALYWSMIISQFFEVRRKLFWQFFMHHVFAIILYSVSWVCNLHRIGCLVTFLHDGPAAILDAAKAAKHANYVKVGICLLVVFLLASLFLRAYLILFCILRSAIFRAPTLMTMFPAYYLLTFVAFLLLGLHISWTWLLTQWAYKSIIRGQVDADTSSSSENSDSSHQPFQRMPNMVNKET